VNSEKVSDVAFLPSVEKHLFYTRVQDHIKITENIFFIAHTQTEKPVAAATGFLFGGIAAGEDSKGSGSE